uniref:Uncharacterized protein n=1 Tax=Amphimedon queenslandica TaxID=400682 RepID=A0A1X7T5E2_AMPQE
MAVSTTGITLARVNSYDLVKNGISSVLSDKVFDISCEKTLKGKYTKKIF